MNLFVHSKNFESLNKTDSSLLRRNWPIPMAGHQPVGFSCIAGGCTEYITVPQHLNTIALWCKGIVKTKYRLWKTACAREKTV